MLAPGNGWYHRIYVRCAAIFQVAALNGKQVRRPHAMTARPVLLPQR
jgi:hypothetical protein